MTAFPLLFLQFGFDDHPLAEQFGKLTLHAHELHVLLHEVATLLSVLLNFGIAQLHHDIVDLLTQDGVFVVQQQAGNDLIETILLLHVLFLVMGAQGAFFFANKSGEPADF